MNGRAILMVALMTAVALSGCAKEAPETVVVEDDVPDEIDQQQVSEIEDEIVSKFPRRFSFPGQELLEPITVFLNDTLGPGSGGAGVELPRDTGAGVYGNTLIAAYDLDEHVPVGQPVEMRIKLKWWGNPGASGDLDIFVDVPGTNDARDPNSFDESVNWNVVTKFRVVNTVRAEGAAFQVGIEAANGKIFHPDGMQYSIQVDMSFPDRVLAPGIAYAVDVPANASRLLFESEPVEGDEHIKGEFMVIGPDDKLLRHFEYDDIGVDTRLVTVRDAGEYIIYAPHLHGGFLRVSTDVPNELFQARIVPIETTEVVLASNAVAPATMEGTFDLEGFPLEMHAYLRPGASQVGAMPSAALNLTSGAGWVTTTEVTGNVQEGDSGRIGNSMSSVYRNQNLADGSWTWTAEGSVGAGVDAGYRMVTYTR